jgi:glutathione S-transferase
MVQSLRRGATAIPPREGEMTLVIGNKNYSSWSLRAWLCMKHSGLDFEEVRLALHTPSWDRQIYNYNPAGLVPALIDGELTIWDSWAITEHLLETRAGALWLHVELLDQAIEVGPLQP